MLVEFCRTVSRMFVCWLHLVVDFWSAMQKSESRLRSNSPDSLFLPLIALLTKRNVDLTVRVLTFYVQRVLHTEASTLDIIKESLFSLQRLCSIHVGHFVVSFVLYIFFIFLLLFCPNSSPFCPKFSPRFAESGATTTLLHLPCAHAGIY